MKFGSFFFCVQSGGFSPRKLRSMLLGVEKKRKEEEVVDSTFSLRSDANEIDDRGEDLKKLVSFLDFVEFFCLIFDR